MLDECAPTSNEKEPLSDTDRMDIVIALTVHVFNLKILADNPRYSSDSDIITHSMQQLRAIVGALMDDFGISEEALMESLQKSHEEERIKIIEETENEDSRMYG